jgi:type VI secretion system protein ImpL
VPTKVTLDSSVLFASGSSQVTPAGATLLSRVAESLKTPPPTGSRRMIKVLGYADVMGRPSTNVTLSQDRANVVRAAFIAHGIRPDSLQALGRGSLDPVVECPESMSRSERVACLAPNRRVEVDIRLVPVE